MFLPMHPNIIIPTRRGIVTLPKRFPHPRPLHGPRLHSHPPKSFVSIPPITAKIATIIKFNIAKPGSM